MENAIAKTDSFDNFTGGIISTIQANTQEEKLELYDKVSNAEPLADHINEIINIENVIIQPVEIEDMNTGDMKPMFRIVIIDDGGNPFACTSSGIETAMKNLFTMVGNPPWNPALPMKVVQRKGNKGYKFTSLEYAPKKK